MKLHFVHRRPTWHWITLAAVVVGIVVLGEFCLRESGRRPDIGMGVAWQGSQLSVVRVQLTGLAHDVGVSVGDSVVDVAGVPATDSSQLTTLPDAGEVRIRKGDGSLLAVSASTALPLSPQRRISFLLLTLGFMGIGAAVFVLSREGLAAWVVLGLTASASAGFLGSLATPARAPWASAIVVTGLVGAATCFLLLFLVFPVNRLRARGAIVATSLCLGAGVVVTGLFYWALAVDSSNYPAVKSALYSLVSLDLFIGCLLGVISFKQATHERREARRALGFVVLGAMAGVLPFCLLSLVPYLLRQTYLLEPEIAILSILFLPAGVAVAILHRQFLGIHQIVTRSAVALVVWLGLVALYGNVFYLTLGADVSAGVLGLAIIAGTFPFVERRIRRACERMLFPEVYDYPRTLQQLTNEIVALSGLASVAGHVLHRLGSLLGLEWAAISLQPANLPPLRYDWGKCPRPPSEPPALGSGAVPATPTTDQSVCSTIALVSEGRVIGSLQLGPKHDRTEFSSEDEMLVATLVPIIATALRNGLLVHSLAERIAALNEREQRLGALNLRLVTVQEDERRRLALDLHDDPLQRTLLLARSVHGNPAESEVLRWREALEEVATSLRATCSELRPPTLDDLGLVPALESLVSNARARSDLTIDLKIEPSWEAWRTRLHPQCETTLYRVAQEGLNNCLKHAKASEVVVSLVRDSGLVKLTICDNGAGARTYESNGTGGLGIVGMRERLRAWDGTLRVGRQTPNGTVLSAEIPLEEAR